MSRFRVIRLLICKIIISEDITKEYRCKSLAVMFFGRMYMIRQVFQKREDYE